jgi:hypothetical protein
MAAEKQRNENNITLSNTEIFLNLQLHTLTDVETYKEKDFLGF